MIRDVDMSQISDGKLYGPSDLVRADTGGCPGCSRCCREMTDTILLDPWDVCALGRATGESFGEMLQSCLQLQMADGLTLPFFRPRPGDGACPFLNEEGRCGVYLLRPGFCRLFPLGRIYEGRREFKYFLQVHECDRPRSKVKVRKWLGIPNLPAYEAYVSDWHAFLTDARQVCGSGGEGMRKLVCMAILQIFYEKPYVPSEAFYEIFAQRLEEGYRKIGYARPAD